MATQIPALIPTLAAPLGYRTQSEDSGMATDLLCFYLLRKSIARVIMYPEVPALFHRQRYSIAANIPQLGQEFRDFAVG